MGVDRLPEEIGRALERGATVVTGNQRAARTLRHAYDRYKQGQGLAGWNPPAILAWETWAATLWREMILEGHATSLLLNRTPGTCNLARCADG